jgi:hypothetical protein
VKFSRTHLLLQFKKKDKISTEELKYDNMIIEKELLQLKIELVKLQIAAIKANN